MIKELSQIEQPMQKIDQESKRALTMKEELIDAWPGFGDVFKRQNKKKARLNYDKRISNI